MENFNFNLANAILKKKVDGKVHIRRPEYEIKKLYKVSPEYAAIITEKTVLHTYVFMIRKENAQATEEISI